MRGHFQSHDKDGGYTIWSAVAENPWCMQTLWLCFIEPELLLIKVWHCGNRDLQPFWLLWPWPWPDELHIWTWSVLPRDIPDEQKWTSYSKALESHITHTHTSICHPIYVPLCFAGGQQYVNLSSKTDRTWIFSNMFNSHWVEEVQASAWLRINTRTNKRKWRESLESVWRWLLMQIIADYQQADSTHDGRHVKMDVGHRLTCCNVF